MVVQQLIDLTEEERQLVLTAPALIAVLISGADAKFSKAEEEQAFKAVHFRGSQGDKFLFDYYKMVDQSFESAIMQIKQKYGESPQARAEGITDTLRKLNEILPKIDIIYATALLENWRSLAKSIATSSGGIFGYAAISYAESHFVDLEMITFK